jgi:hypothetical protein
MKYNRSPNDKNIPTKSHSQAKAALAANLAATRFRVAHDQQPFDMKQLDEEKFDGMFVSSLVIVLGFVIFGLPLLPMSRVNSAGGGDKSMLFALNFLMLPSAGAQNLGEEDGYVDNYYIIYSCLLR